jgi:hypothetical protein
MCEESPVGHLGETRNEETRAPVVRSATTRTVAGTRTSAPIPGAAFQTAEALVVDNPKDHPMRLYFHLLKGTEAIRDEDGIEVSDVAAARAEALKTIREMRSAEDRAPPDWTGWKLAVADESGALLFSLDVDTPV